MATNDKQVIFSLINVGKVYPPKRQVLREIYLGFFYGAKKKAAFSSCGTIKIPFASLMWS